MILNKFFIVTILILAMLPMDVLAVMKSSNYVIYENVLNPFDGPAIANVSSSAGSTSATITWNTNVPADGFVIYSADSGFASYQEQGSSAKDSASHSVTVTGLTAGTTYYFKVKSTRINGGTTTDSTVRSFATVAVTTSTSVQFVYTGGVLVVGKKETTPPIITGVKAENLGAGKINITWLTSEDATSFIEYGLTDNYGQINGNWDLKGAHAITIINLKPDTTYHYRIVSSDDSGNIVKSGDYVIKTTLFNESLIADEVNTEIKEIKDNTDQGDSKETIIAKTSNNILDFIKKIIPPAGTDSQGEDSAISQFDILEKLTSLMPSPKIVGEPTVEAEANTAIISWQTDINANSLVALAPVQSYDAKKDEPYIQIVGNTENYATNHQVRIFGLNQDTLYHFQARSKSKLGPTGKSGDYTFRTKLELFAISNYYSQIIDNETAVFKWVTNAEADSSVTIAPYRGNNLVVNEAKTFKNSSISVIHEITIKEFQAGVYYQVELKSQDLKGNIALETIPAFSTSADDLPPVIFQVQTNSTIFINSNEGIQTIISWKTNDPSTSQVYYIEGVHQAADNWPGKTKLDDNYTRDHVMVITNFNPGIVYSFRVESVDAGGSAAISDVHTFMTPKRKESIFSIVLKILEDTFSWITRLV
ncbi:hypothetical protein AUJ27_03475 [Candidatus Falkowbacteria bacterium CG1_02_37_44]|uniref:Fibronectin type-III domain-containing protein n=1 Tax=Candidatus Falkowbacteria bacterium CG1_02_37_44 TaxID=1805146 RepID=A0A1J4T657_9BACT|nr:MAG: hypothetical protein AUJ27_03475 [Candidatus Falkowbacteria bacterium CG1_02_37_44]